MHETDVQQDIEALIAHRSDHAVSIYLSGRRTPDEHDAFETRVKNSLRQVAEFLPESLFNDLKKRTLRELPEIEQRAQKGSGVAIFFSSNDEFRVSQLWFSTADLSIVGTRYHLRPIVAALSLPLRYRILSISLQSVRLFEVDTNGHHAIQLDSETPQSLDQVTLTQEQPPLTFHGNGRGDASRRGDVVFHGHDHEQRRRQENIKRFLRGVAQGVKRAVLSDSRPRNSRNVPLILHGVPEITHQFRREAEHIDLVLSQEEVPGSPEHLTESELISLAAPHARQALEKRVDEIRQQFHELEHTAKTASGLTDVLRAASDGRIESLMLCSSSPIWGRFDAEGRTAQIEQDAQADVEDLLDRAAVDTFRQGGSVYQINENRQDAEPALALLRF